MLAETLLTADQRIEVRHTVTAKAARDLIRSGKAPDDLHINGHLNLADSRKLTHLPKGLTVGSLDLTGCTSLRELPVGLEVRRLKLRGCTSLRELPAGLHVYDLDARGAALRTLPADLRVDYRLNLEGCTALASLPDGLKVGSLILRNCTQLAALPEGLETYFLDISGCTNLETWPAQASVHVGRLTAQNCPQLQSLPSWLTNLAELDLAGCVSLASLPPNLVVTSVLDVAQTMIKRLPKGVQGAQLRWRGVPIEPRLLLHPETITVSEVLEQPNAELRRVLLERMGYETFIAAAGATVLDLDFDRGGERRLLKVAIPGDEALVCVAVICPSTARQYLIRVPPSMRSCRQAVAWMAGFDNPDDYQPIVES